MQRKFKLVVLHGTHDRAAHVKFHNENQIKLGVPDDKRTEPKCDVLAIFAGEGEDRLELRVTNWDDAAELKQDQTYTLTVV